jgi:hypothetical protein
MPGTNYTTNLRLSNPSLNDTGWGTTVSSGMIDLTDQAIAGLATADVTLGNVTLTIVDGSAGTNSARNMFLNITGTPGVARDVIVPTNRKLYFVTNNCGQIATVKVSGQPGVAVPAGASMTLRINAAGTDVAPTFTYAASMSLGTALPATSGGTGQSSFAVGDLLYASSTTAISKLTVGATDAVLTVAAGIPSWVATLPAVSGGTGLSSPGTAGNVLSSAGATWQSVAVSTLVPAATYLIAGVVELANTSEVQAGTDTSRAITPADFRQGALVQGTVQNSTSGTVVDFTGIPSWAKRIIVMLFGVSTNGSTRMIVQIGTTSGIETAGYFSNASYGGASSAMYTTNTTGYVLEPTGAASAGYTRYGSIVIENFYGNTWVSRSCISCYGGDVTSAGAGGKTLSATLDRVRVTTVAAGDTFDAGQINIMYE